MSPVQGCDACPAPNAIEHPPAPLLVNDASCTAMAEAEANNFYVEGAEFWRVSGQPRPKPRQPGSGEAAALPLTGDNEAGRPQMSRLQQLRAVKTGVWRPGVRMDRGPEHCVRSDKPAGNPLLLVCLAEHPLRQFSGTCLLSASPFRLTQRDGPAQSAPVRLGCAKGSGQQKASSLWPRSSLRR